MIPPGRAILIAEDNPDDRYLLSEVCREVPVACSCVMVEDGEEAVAYLEGRGPYGDRLRHPPPALILLDVKMPRRTGHETLAWIRASPAWARLPAIMLSSSLHPGDIERSYALGANAYAVKPSSVEELADFFLAVQAFWLRFNEFPPEL